MTKLAQQMAQQQQQPSAQDRQGFMPPPRFRGQFNGGFPPQRQIPQQFIQPPPGPQGQFRPPFRGGGGGPFDNFRPDNNGPDRK